MKMNQLQKTKDFFEFIYLHPTQYIKYIPDDRSAIIPETFVGSLIGGTSHLLLSLALCSALDYSSSKSLLIMITASAIPIATNMASGVYELTHQR